MRAIDADALKRKAQKVATEAWKMKITGSVETILNQFIDWIDAAPTIEPRCEECESFNKTRLLVPQPQRKKGKWIDDDGNAATDKYCATCSACGEWSEYLTAYCPNCGADMREPEDIPMEYFESGGR